MFWFNKGKEPENYTKEKQIRELSISFPSLRRPNQDDNLFEIIFEIDRKYNTLKIYLPSDFPANKPGTSSPTLCVLSLIHFLSPSSGRTSCSSLVGSI
jgi:hypothetical protein